MHQRTCPALGTHRYELIYSWYLPIYTLPYQFIHKFVGYFNYVPTWTQPVADAIYCSIVRQGEMKNHEIQIKKAGLFLMAVMGSSKLRHDPSRPRSGKEGYRVR